MRTDEYIGNQKFIFVPRPDLGICIVHDKWRWPLTSALLECWGLA